MRLITIALIFLLRSADASAHAGADIDKAIDSIRASQKDFIICDADCPTYLALVALHFAPPTSEQAAERFERCLATLIAPDEILTNAHCIPSPTVHKFIRVIFPKARAHPSEVARVERVLKVSDTAHTPLFDYAVLKLDRRLTRPPARLNPTEIAEGQQLEVFTHFVQQDAESGVNFIKLKSKKCAASTAIEPDGKHDVTLKLNGCIPQDGDSGGPILTPNRDLVGVVWGGGANGTFGLNLMCLPDPLGTIPTGKCVQSVELAATHLGQTVAFNQIFEVQEFGVRAPVAGLILGGKIFLSALNCFSKIPDKPIVIRQPAIFVEQKSLDQQKIPIEAETPFVELTTIMTLQAEGQILSIEVLSEEHSHLLSYHPEPCL